MKVISLTLKMEVKMKHFLATLVLSTTLLTSFARANDESRLCSNIVKRQLPMLEHTNEFATNDLVLFSFFSMPIILLFPPTAVVVSAPIYFKARAVIKVKNAKDLLAIYDEAANEGGKKTRKLYRKLLKMHPSSELTYEEFLEAIHESDLNGTDCQKELPKKKDILTIVEADA